MRTKIWRNEGVRQPEKALNLVAQYCDNLTASLQPAQLIVGEDRNLRKTVVVLAEAEKTFQNLRVQEGVVDDLDQGGETSSTFRGQVDLDEVRDEGAFKGDGLPSHTTDKEVNLLSKKFQLVIKILAYSRSESLVRCLHSLKAADYGGDIVKLDIHIDHIELPTPVDSLGKGRLTGMHTASAGTQEDTTDDFLRNSFSVLSHADQFKWLHGPKEVHFRSKNAGIQGQWIEAWWPSTDDEFALVVEDDMELSPLFYRYLRSVVATYFYNPVNFDPSVFGISLQRPRLVAGTGGSTLAVDNSTRLYLYQMIGTWGQLLFPNPWKEFRIWYEIHKTKGFKPVLEGMITNKWYKKLGERIWTPWFIKFVHARHYYNLYTNFLQERALSVSHRDAGVNYKSNTGPDSQLIVKPILDIDLWEMAPLKRLKRFNFCFHQVVPKEVVGSRSEKLQPLLESLHASNEIVLVSLLGVPEALVRNWLCHIEKLGLQNLLLLGDNIALLNDLGRRGHAVMHAMLGKREKKLLLVAGSRKTDAVSYRRDLLTVSSIKSVTGLGYDVLFSRADTVWLKYPLRNVTIPQNVAAVRHGKVCSSGFLYVRSSKNAQKFLNCVWEKLVSAVESSSSHGDAVSNHMKAGAWGELGCKCSADNQIPMIFLDAERFPLFSNWPGDANGSPAGYSAPAVLLLDGLKHDQPLRLAKDMRKGGYWVVDDDLACLKVSCKRNV